MKCSSLASRDARFMTCKTRAIKSCLVAFERLGVSTGQVLQPCGDSGPLTV